MTARHSSYGTTLIRIPLRFVRHLLIFAGRLGRDAVPALIQDVFGVEDKNQLKQGKTSLPVLDTEMNERVRAVVDKSKDHRGKGCGSIIQPPLYLIREDGEPSLRLWAQTLLVEDRADQGVSGAQFLGSLREKVLS